MAIVCILYFLSLLLISMLILIDQSYMEKKLFLKYAIDIIILSWKDWTCPLMSYSSRQATKLKLQFCLYASYIRLSY